MNTWILVATAARARLFASGDHDGEMVELADYQHGESRMHGRDLERDAAPSSHESAGVAGHAIEPHTDIRDREAQVFARALADELEHGRVDHAYERLILVAPPRFLGQLRAALDDQVAKLVTRTLDKDVSRASPDEIEAMLAR